MWKEWSVWPKEKAATHSSWSPPVLSMWLSGTVTSHRLVDCSTPRDTASPCLPVSLSVATHTFLFKYFLLLLDHDSDSLFPLSYVSSFSTLSITGSHNTLKCQAVSSDFPLFMRSRLGICIDPIPFRCPRKPSVQLSSSQLSSGHFYLAQGSMFFLTTFLWA